MNRSLISRCTALLAAALLGCGLAHAAEPASAFDVASELYESGKQREALVTLQQLAEQGDARAQYVVAVDLIEGTYIPRNYALAFAYILLAADDKQFGDLVAPAAKATRAEIEPQLSGKDLIQADAIVGEYHRKRDRK